MRDELCSEDQLWLANLAWPGSVTGELIRRHSGLIGTVMFGHYPKVPLHVANKEELYAIGLEYLWRAIRAYHPAMGVPFSAYACRAIRAGMGRHLKRLTRQRRLLTTELRDEVVDPARAALSAEDRDMLHAMVDCLPPYWGEVVRAHVMGGKTCAAVGAEMGISKQAVQQTRDKAMRALSKSIRAAGLHPANKQDWLHV